MKDFFRYVLSHRRYIIFVLVSVGFFAASFALYGIPVSAVIYPSVIVIALGAVFAAVSFYRNKARRDRVRRAKYYDDPLTMLPAPASPIEREYTQLVTDIMKVNRDLISKHEAELSDMEDYYTTWAHQIKTPIASMYLKLQNDDSELSRSLKNDLFRVEQYSDMVMTYLRLGKDGSDFVIRRFEVEKIIRAAVKKFTGEFIMRRLELRFSGSEIVTLSDEKWLQFVIEQVLSNALKYTRSGHIAIYDDGDTLCIADTGIGISPEDLPRIFGKGYTGENGRLQKRASGLGLYLCRRTMEKLNHTISIESEVGRGTVVKLDLGRKLITLE